MTLSLSVTDNPDSRDQDFIAESLTAFNDADVGNSDRREIAVFARDETQSIIAGLTGYTAWGWLFVQRLFVSEAARGQDLAGRMLRQAEEEALRRGCKGAFIDTFSPTAEKAYTRQGYRPFGAMEDFPIGSGRRRVYLQKRL
ncbi:GNAT family N-acetyltransferase [Martelella sp. HB161492]|uniref:GNAT family N-acetyltransferase n=1 Tax=Martelella sp. HB161492 TaxID=2720726 RepID=UPI0015914A7C|nr:GNAT family N-acetyltransferase [Martelella sp. HB161492]